MKRLLFSGLLLWTAALHAQDTATRQLGEVRIHGSTARSRLLTENPAALQVISGAKTAQLPAPNLIDALVKLAPGLSAVKTGPNISKPFIRGLGYNRVLTLYDGIRQEGQQWGDEHGIEVDPYQVQKTVLVKGPASLLYGADAIAGVISFYSFMPDRQDSLLHIKLVSEYQSNNGLWGNSVQLYQGSKHWLWNLGAAARFAKNYRNAADGRVYLTGFNEQHAGGMAGYAGTHGSITLHGTLYDNLQGIPDGSRDSATRRFTKQVHEATADAITQRPVVSDRELNSYHLSPLHQHIQHYRLYTQAQYQAGNSSFHALVAWQQNTRREYNHPLHVQQAGMFVQLQTLQYNLDYYLTLPAGFEAAAGISGVHQQNRNRDATDFPIPDYRLNDRGGYAYLKWKSNRFVFSAGVRTDQRYIQAPDFYLRNNPATGFDMHVTGSDTAGAVLQFAALRQRFNGTSFSMGTTYRINGHLSLKANLARAFRSPNIAEIASNGLDPGAHIVYLGNRDFKPEFSLEEDLGLLANYEGFTATVGVFHNHISHYIYLSQLTDAQGAPVVLVPGNKTYQYQQANARLYGVEASFTAAVPGCSGLSLGNNFAVAYGYNAGAAFRGKGIYGEYLPLIPPLENSATLTQTFTSRCKWLPAWHASAEWQYTAAQRRYLALNNTETPTPAYQLVNIGAGATIAYGKNKTTNVVVQVNNLLNTVYQSSLSRLKYFEYYQVPAGARSGIYNMGLNACIKIIAVF